MTANNFTELKRHVSHRVVVVEYGERDGDIANVAVECEDCNEILLDYDNPVF